MERCDTCGVRHEPATEREFAIDGETWAEWVEHQFAEVWCDECWGDAPDHEPYIINGHWFAHCRQPLAPGVTVESQGITRHWGVVLDRPHVRQDWVWVEWEHVGVTEEYLLDIEPVRHRGEEAP